LFGLRLIPRAILYRVFCHAEPIAWIDNQLSSLDCLIRFRKFPQILGHDNFNFAWAGSLITFLQNNTVYWGGICFTLCMKKNDNLCFHNQY